jgi:hypothetical protein
MTKKLPARWSGVLIFRVFRRLLAGSDGLARADAGASAAVDADIRVDAVHIAFLDGAGRAFALAGSTSHAEIGIDYVSHSFVSLNCCSVFLKGYANIGIKFVFQTIDL